MPSGRPGSLLVAMASWTLVIVGAAAETRTRLLRRAGGVDGCGAAVAVWDTNSRLADLLAGLSLIASPWRFSVTFRDVRMWPKATNTP